MRRGGDTSQGYEIEVDAKARVVSLRCWGNWELSTAAAYERDLLAAFAPLEGSVWYVLGDIQDFPPQRPEVAAVHGALMAHAHRHGMKRAASLVSSAMTQLQIRRLSTESGLPELAFHKDRSAALAWLLSG